MDVDLRVSRNRLEPGVELGIHGRVARDFDPRSLALLSRAVHKLAFENLAWSVRVKGLAGIPPLPSRTFDPVREWARRGAPPHACPPDAVDGSAAIEHRIRIANPEIRGRHRG